MNTVNLAKQTVNLSKKQTVNLSKQSDNGLTRVMIALGWDEADKSPVSGGGFFSRLFGGGSSDQRGHSNYDFDLDAWVAPMKNGKNINIEDIIYFGRKDWLHKGMNIIHHCGDNLTGAGDGDDEQIIIDLANMPSEYDQVLVAVTIYKGNERRQTFGDIKNIFVRAVDEKTGFEMCRYSDSNLAEYKDCYTFIVGVLFKENNEWKFRADGYGTKDTSISYAASKYKRS